MTKKSAYEKLIKILDYKKKAKKGHLKNIYFYDLLKFIIKSTIFPFGLFISVGYYYCSFQREIGREFKYYCNEIENINKKVINLKNKKKISFLPEEKSNDKFLNNLFKNIFYN